MDTTGPQDDERRVDLESRDRVVALEQRWRATAVGLIAAIVVLTIGVVLALVRVGDALDQIQRQREAAIVSSCLDRNAQNAGIVAFVAHVAPDFAVEARGAFPVRPSCIDYARALVAG